MFETKIILDTNFLMIPGQFGLDIFSEIERIVDFKYKLCFVEGTIRELWGLSEGFGKKAQYAKLAIVLAEKKKLKKLSGKGYVDDVLVEYAKKGAIICSQDLDLKKRVFQEGGKVITVRSKKHLVFQD